MIGKILTGIFTLIINLINLLLSPIDSLISSSLPSLDNALSYVSALFNYISSVIGFCIDASGLSSFAINLIVIYFTFSISVTFAISTIKLALRWYNKLKP